MELLKYLFIAEFEDGSAFDQTPQDQSLIDPLRNCFYDVLQSGKEIIKFSLKGEGNLLSVNLKTGVFEVNGLQLFLESERLPKLPEKFNLIWYHQVTKNLSVTYSVQNRDIKSVKELLGTREYFIGWQCNIDGKNYQQKLAIA